MPSAFSRDLARIAVPIVLQNFIVSAVNLVDTVMVGRLGADAIAAVGLANQVYFLLLLCLFGIGSGSAVFTAQYWGKGDLQGIRRTVGLSLSLAAFVGLAYGLVAVVAPASVLRLYTADPRVVAIGVPYLRTVGFSYLATSLSFVFSLALRSVERVRLPLAGTVVALAVNVALNWVLIFGIGFFPRLGVLGAGIATAAARWIEVFIVVGGSYLKRYPPAGRLSEFLSADRAFVGSFALIAAPVVVNEVFWSLGMTVHSAVFARVSTEAAASYGILQSIMQLLNVMIFGSASAAAVMIGKKIGENDPATARAWAARFAFSAPLLGLGVGACALAAVPALPFLFEVEPAVLTQSAFMLAALAAVYPVKSYNLHYIVGIGRAGGDTRFGMFFDLFGVWGIGVPAALVGAFVLRLPPWGVFLLLSSEEVVKFFLAAARIKSGKWLRLVVS